ncbi:MAG TPA: mechanosensitive ion channel family protein [Candidatus Omnitrophota bacterium]|nr:mechanosensitive ion channel family protein [Candidatus Omnitrophota bacterium]
MDTVTRFIEQIKNGVSPWVYGPVIFLLWTVILVIGKRIIFSKFRQIAQKTKFRFDDVFISAAQFPVTLLILGSGLYFQKLILPLDPKSEQMISVTIQAAIIVGAVLFLDRLIKNFGQIYSQRAEFAFASRGILQGLIRGTIIGLGILIFLDLLGISVTPILASLGIGSLAVALGLQETLTNFFAGIYITIDKPVQVGDFIKLESGEEGYVTEVGWRATRIRMLPNNTVIVPNQKLMSTIITNYYLPSPDLAVLVQVGVHYDSDLKKVEEVTIDVGRQIMKTIQGGVPEFEPFIRYHTFDSSSINFTVILRGKEFVDQYLVKHEFIKALHERYKKEGITIPYPMQTLHIPPETIEALKNH